FKGTWLPQHGEPPKATEYPADVPVEAGVYPLPEDKGLPIHFNRDADQRQGLILEHPGTGERVLVYYSTGFEDKIKEALNSDNEGTRLEGEVAKAVNEVGSLVDFNKTIRPDGTAFGLREIDVETPNYIVEVTNSKGSINKGKQLEAYINDKRVNPTGKKVILFAPHARPQQIKAFEKVGAEVITTIETLLELDL
ncbi:MAG: hypothetical protein ACR2PX_24620, partial [Endozoicomonas sp.]|uniref:hypothetical protein n=1 Tax=Endozoicomonas sp. TaxID=1892382 RepID=UPI003D9AD4B6